MVSNCNKKIADLTREIDDLKTTVRTLEARVEELLNQGAWTSDTILTSVSDVDFKAIFGITKEQWLGYIDQLDLYGASALWKHKKVDWKTGYAISQIKLRQNLIYALIKKLFNVPASTCSTIFKSCVEFRATVAIKMLDTDSREYSALFRMDGIRYDHHGVKWTRINYLTDANEIPMQNMKNEESAHKGHSDYYDDARLKHQAVLDQSGELFWTSIMYLPKGASDQELLKNGVSLAAGDVPAKKVYDLMQGW